MTGAPQLREAAWFITGPDRDPVRHLFVRLEEHMDGSGIWTVEVHECRGDRKARGRYAAEADARAVLDEVYAFGRRLPPLATWEPGRLEPGRWRVSTSTRSSVKPAGEQGS